MSEMIAVVQMYIHIMKGKEVDISIRTPHDYLKLNHAYNIASKWMSDNNVIVNKV